MTSLTQIAYIARKSINLGILIIVLITIIRIVVGFAYSLWQERFPPPPPAATVAFGKLPYPRGENSLATPSALSYTVETIDGTLPVLPPNLEVYFVPQPTASFGTFQRMTSKAGLFGFSGVPVKLGQNVWKFTDQTNPLRTMNIDEISGDFRIVYNYVADPTLFQTKAFISDDQAIGLARRAFNELLEGSGYEKSAPTLTYYRYDAGILVETTSLSQADAVAVSFVHDPIGETPVVSPDFKQGLVSVIVTSSTDPKRQVLELRYFHDAIDLGNFATYPVITSQQALEKLESQEAIFASLPSQISGQVTIREVSLVYMLSYPAQSYLQPMLAFSDQQGFIAYVPLVTPEWLEAP